MTALMNSGSWYHLGQFLLCLRRPGSWINRPKTSWNHINRCGTSRQLPGHGPGLQHRHGLGKHLGIHPEAPRLAAASSSRQALAISKPVSSLIRV